jgi:hypothetical protein
MQKHHSLERSTTMFKRKRTTRTVLVTTALAAGLLGSVPLAHAGISVPGRHPDGISVPGRHPDGISVPGRHPDIISVLGPRAASLGFPPGPSQS